MKKNLRRAMASVMAAALALSLAGTATEADAAKKIKFASNSVTVTVKKTKTVKIKNVKAKKVKKLAVKSANKKIATVSKKGKTAVKVKGKKAGNTKVTATLTIKGQKKKTKLTLKVKVKKVTSPTVTQAPATQAPPAVTQAPPAVTQAPPAATQAPATDVPGPATDTPPTKVPPTKRPPWTPEPDKKVSNVSITYDYEFPGNRVVKFDGTVVGHSDESDAETYENAKAVGYPEGGIDVRYYDKVVVKYKGEADLIGDGSWFGKATLSSTDDGLGMNEYSDGLYLKYLNDIGRNSDGIYVVEYTIDQSGNGMVDGFDFEDVGLVDCISVQMANTEEDFAGFKLLSADFITNSPAEPDKTEEPSTPDPNTPNVTIKLGKANIAEGETTSVEAVAPEGVEVTEQKWSAEDTKIAEVNGNVVTAKGVGETKIKLEAVAKSGGKDYNVTADAKLTVKEKGAVIVNLENAPAALAINETAMITVTVDTGTIESVEWKVDNDKVTVDGDNTEALVTGAKVGEATVTATVTVKSGEKTAVEEASATIKVTPKAYVINKAIEISNPKEPEDTDFYDAIFDEPIRVKKTDIIKVVFSVKSGSEDSMAENTAAKVVVELSASEADATWNKHQNAELRADAEGSTAGEVLLNVDEDRFVGNYAEVSSALVHLPEGINADKVVVTIEKILVEPTDEVAFSIVKKLAVLEENSTDVIKAEVDDGYQLVWTSEDTSIATVKADENDQTIAMVTGVKAGDASIKVQVKAADGKVITEKTLTFTVSGTYKNKELALDLGDGETFWNDEHEFTTDKTGGKVTSLTVSDKLNGIAFKLPNNLAAGEKIQVIVKGSFADNATEGFRVYVGEGPGDGKVTNAQLGVYNTTTPVAGPFTSDPIELEATAECTHLTLRSPSNVTITGVTVIYL